MKTASAVVAIVAAIGLAAVGFLRGTYAAGGSDSSCYALMADAFASGNLQPSSALASQVPWPDAPKTFAPGGFVPSQSNPAAAAPVCAPGFSVLLAPVVKLGGANALFAFTPIAGALFVWFSYLAARTLGGPPAGAMAAVLAATNPIVLFQVVQPMNDITTAMLWMAAFAALISNRWTTAGVCCGLALLVRPNLLPLALVAGTYALTSQLTLRTGDVGARDAGAGKAVGGSLSAALGFALGAAPFLVLILWLNNAMYGGPLRSGYGQLGNLFSLRNIATNTGRYGRWLIQTQTILLALGFLAPLAVDKSRRRSAWLALGLITATAVIYFAYTPFDDWSYLRFLLPAIGILIVLTSVVTARVGSLAGSRQAYIGVGLVSVGMGIHGIGVARERLAFQMHALEQRYISAGVVARDRLPAGAAVLTTWDSGAIRFHARKEAIVWDALDPAWLDRALAWLSERGHQPFILVESWEEPRFRARFAASSPVGNLDWPPKYEVDRLVRFYDPADRIRYLRGEKVITEYLWPLRKE